MVSSPHIHIFTSYFLHTTKIFWRIIRKILLHTFSFAFGRQYFPKRKWLTFWPFSFLFLYWIINTHYSLQIRSFSFHYLFLRRLLWIWMLKHWHHTICPKFPWLRRVILSLSGVMQAIKLHKLIGITLLRKLRKRIIIFLLHHKFNTHSLIAISNQDLGKILPGKASCFLVLSGRNFEAIDNSKTAFAYSPYKYLKLDVIESSTASHNISLSKT